MALLAVGQQKKIAKDSIRQLMHPEKKAALKDSAKLSKPKKNFRPYEFKVGTNIFRAGQSLASNSYNSQEIQAALSLYKYVIFVDFGVENNFRGNGYSYQNKGSYYRIGFDKNFIGNTDSGNVLALGLRYARANFNDKLNGKISSLYNNGELNLSNPKLSARWFEIVFDLRGKLISQLYSGFTLRWQFAKKVNGQQLLQTFDVPGYGTLKRSTAFMFDYYIAWRIPFKKKKKEKSSK